MKPLRLAPPHRPHRYPSALGELDGIAQQVEQHLLEMQGIHQHPVLEIPVEFQCQGKILLPRQPTNQRQDSSDQLARKHWFGS